MKINEGLLNNISINNTLDKFLIGDNIGHIIEKPRIDLKVKGNINWDKKCASLSIEFKLFFI